MATRDNDDTKLAMAYRLVMSTISHPFEYAKVLIQIGHEPIAPYPTTTLFGKPALALPSVFKYVAHIKAEDGFFGLYRGLGPKLCATAVSTVTHWKCFTLLDVKTSVREEDMTEDERRKYFLRCISRDISCRTVAVIVSQPFNVIAIRMMAQFVGGETKYSNILSSVVEVYHENGIFGFFSGLVPRVLGEIASLIIASSLTYVINFYLVPDGDLKTYAIASLSFIASAITYPFQVVSNCMAVSNSGLIAGTPPQMPIYESWTDCWSDLSRNRQLKRGSSLLFRYYTGPKIVIQGHSNPAVIKNSNILRKSL